MKTILAAALVALAFAPAHAQQNKCFAYDQLTVQLESKHGESVQSRGLMQGALLEMWANSESGTWTAVVRRPDGVGCIAAAGNTWRRVEPTPPGDLS